MECQNGFDVEAELFWRGGLLPWPCPASLERKDNQRAGQADSFNLVTPTYLDDSTCVVRAIVGHPGLKEALCRLLARGKDLLRQVEPPQKQWWPSGY